MATPTKNNINLYETSQDVEKSVPYASISADELFLVMRRFASLAAMLVTHPDTAAKFGDLSTTCIQVATDLRTALKVSRQEHHYPNVVMPMNKYFTAKMIYVQSRSLEPELPDFLQQEIQKWETESV